MSLRMGFSVSMAFSCRPCGAVFSPSPARDRARKRRTPAVLNPYDNVVYQFHTEV
jgi:hypothetical protein